MTFFCFLQSKTTLGTKLGFVLLFNLTSVSQIGDCDIAIQAFYFNTDIAFVCFVLGTIYCAVLGIFNECWMLLFSFTDLVLCNWNVIKSLQY